jgi:TRAP-type C4-dicarboxylate transport system permease small subunit
MRDIMKFIYKLNDVLNKALVFIAGCCLVILISLTCANIILREIWRPIDGTFELMGYLGALMASLALGHTQMWKGHIAVDVLINTFSRRTRVALRALSNFICMILFGLAAWQVAEKATVLKNSGEVTETLRIIYYPFTYAVAIGFVVLTLEMFTELLQLVVPPDKEAT